MKSFFLGMTLSLVFICNAGAQFSLLVEGGANYGKTKIFNEDLGNLISNDEAVGYFFSVVPKYQLTNLFKVNLELQYSLEGYESMNFGPPAIADLHYIRVIPELELKILGPLSVFAGINIGYLAVENIVSKDNQASLNNAVKFSKDVDFGILSGLNVNIVGFNFSLKYNYGLRDINNFNWTDHDGWIIDAITTKNRFLQVGVGYLIDFKI
jgi:opacity protein-like surface antigen